VAFFEYIFILAKYRSKAELIKRFCVRICKKAIETGKTLYFYFRDTITLTNVLRETVPVLFQAKNIQRIRDLEGAGLRRKDECNSLDWPFNNFY
jgi:hypothetical protein